MPAISLRTQINFDYQTCGIHPHLGRFAIGTPVTVGFGVGFVLIGGAEVLDVTVGFTTGDCRVGIKGVDAGTPVFAGAEFAFGTIVAAGTSTETAPVLNIRARLDLSMVNSIRLS